MNSSNSKLDSHSDSSGKSPPASFTENSSEEISPNYSIGELIELSHDVPRFVEIVPNLAKAQVEIAIGMLEYGEGLTKDQKLMIYVLIKKLMIEKHYFNIYPLILKEDKDFKDYFSNFIAEIFDVDQPEELRIEILTNFIYDEKFRQEFHTDTYMISPLYFKYKLDNDNASRNFLKFDKSQKNSIIGKQAYYFWGLIQSIDNLVFRSIASDSFYAHFYLYPHSRAPFSDGPVALLFSGRLDKKTPQLFSDELNCCLFAHHLHEMGYNKENIMCFIEREKLNRNNQIQVFKDKVLCSYDYFRDHLGFLFFRSQYNSPDMFAYSIFKAVADAKGPVLVYYNHHGSEKFLYFSYKPKILMKGDFLSLCEVLETLHKHVLFIIDSCVNDEFFPKCNFEYIHFITSSFKQTNNIENFYHKKFFYHNPMSPSQSSLFTRHLFDSIYKIKQDTSLIDFVNFINCQGCDNFEAKLRSKNPSLNISMFLQPPTFKYFDYLIPIDNYQIDNIKESVDKNSCIDSDSDNSKFDFEEEDKSEIEIKDLINGSNEQIDEYIYDLRYDELWDKYEKEMHERSKIRLKDEQAFFVVNKTIKKFGAYDQALEENPIRIHIYSDYFNILEWLDYNYRFKPRGAMYMNYLISFDINDSRKAEEVKEFIKDLINKLQQNEVSIDEDGVKKDFKLI